MPTGALHHAIIRGIERGIIFKDATPHFSLNTLMMNINIYKLPFYVQSSQLGQLFFLWKRLPYNLQLLTYDILQTHLQEQGIYKVYELSLYQFSS